MKEIWRQIPSFPEYSVSNKGRVRHCLGNKIAKHCYSQEGYHRYGLKNGSKFYSRTVHGLVLEAFVGPRKPGFEACHNDGNPDNNHLSNLRWGTRADNYADRIKHGTCNTGERHGRCVISDKLVKEIRDRHKSGVSGYKMINQYPVSRSQLYRIINGETRLRYNGTAGKREE